MATFHKVRTKTDLKLTDSMTSCVDCRLGANGRRVINRALQIWRANLMARGWQTWRIWNLDFTNDMKTIGAVLNRVKVLMV